MQEAWQSGQKATPESYLPTEHKHDPEEKSLLDWQVLQLLEADPPHEVQE